MKKLVLYRTIEPIVIKKFVYFPKKHEETEEVSEETPIEATEKESSSMRVKYCTLFCLQSSPCRI